MFGHAQYDTKRSEIGELLYKLKYSSDFSVVNEIAETAAMFVRQLAPSPYLFSPTLIVTVPPSRPRSRQPVRELASAIAQKLDIPAELDAVQRTRQLPELKGIHDYTERLELLRDAHTVDAGIAGNKSILLFDDLFRSGASMNSIGNILVDHGGIVDLCALTITKTRVSR